MKDPDYSYFFFSILDQEQAQNLQKKCKENIQRLLKMVG